MTPLKYVGKRKLTDLDRVLAFSRMCYGDKSAPHALLPLWMHYASVGEYLYDKGAQYPTVYAGILQGLFQNSYATLKDILIFGTSIKDFEIVPKIIQGTTMLVASENPAVTLINCVQRDIVPIETVYVYLATLYVIILRSARHVYGLDSRYLSLLEEYVFALTSRINDPFLDEISEDVEDAIFLARRKKGVLVTV